MSPVIQDALRLFAFVKRIPQQYRAFVCYLTGHKLLRPHPRGEECPRCGDVWLDLEEFKRKNREQEIRAEQMHAAEIRPRETVCPHDDQYPELYSGGFEPPIFKALDAENPQRAATPVPHETTDTPGMKA